MNNIFYNIGKQDISNGLKDFEISSSQDYFILLSSPTTANIRIKLNSVTAHEIPIKENWSFESKDVNKIYISCDSVLYGEIIYGQADGNLILKPNPTINKIDSITSIKRLEYPYNFISTEFAAAPYTPTPTGTTVKLFDFIIENDMIEINIRPHVPAFKTANSRVYAQIDGSTFLYALSDGQNGPFATADKFKELKELKGRRLEVYANDGSVCTITKYNYKE